MSFLKAGLRRLLYFFSPFDFTGQKHFIFSYNVSQYRAVAPPIVILLQCWLWNDSLLDTREIEQEILDIREIDTREIEQEI